MGHNEDPPTSAQHDMSPRSTFEVAQQAVEFTKQSEKLSHQRLEDDSAAIAVQADFVTPQDPVIVTSDGNRLPGVPLDEAHKLNVLREDLQGQTTEVEIKKGSKLQEKIPNPAAHHHNGEEERKIIQLPDPEKDEGNGQSWQQDSQGTLRHTMPPSHTNPLFPPLPLYGPPTLLRNIQCWFFRSTSFVLSMEFLGVIVLGSLFTSIPKWCKALFLSNEEKKRPFYEQEQQNAAIRQEKEKDWDPTGYQRRLDVENETIVDEYPPIEGGKDPIICDVGYYARRVGLDVETFKVETEDGFIIELWHVYDPKEHVPLDETSREKLGPTVFQEPTQQPGNPGKKRKFPVLLMHGLLQSSGAYCCNDDQSLAFWLCKSGYDVWLGNNRCGFKPQHVLLDYGDPRMWCWNIRQMGVFDLPALISRVLHETGFEKIGLICHSQGTTQTLVALAKEQRPDLGEKLTVFCALAPAAYAGPLIGKMYFKFMRIISPGMFRLMFGIHAFIPLMMQMHALLDPRLYGWLGYKVFSFLFDWTDERWDRGLRNRMFQFAPVYVSAESMRWWLGRECFAKHKCILATRDVLREEESTDESGSNEDDSETSDENLQTGDQIHKNQHRHHIKGSTAWYNHQVPPFALWVCGDDHLVDGKRLLKRFEAGREPHVKVVHSKVIPEYQHLDVIWAMDAPDQVFREIREVLWKTCDVRDSCRIPEGCDTVPKWEPAEVVAMEASE
ncbi:alpha/beta-hydrolase lipase region domain-containing protein [Trichoderma breve]|uniref:Alpha/beta-hydrolase lipase region domain-containing protein n=1 Tax=Trichoderma breve TaxID=2034170 RepID=A0A9W9B875_9HYPO|nr:alpha/beta-hydrolase lipase region domain-containing protein [Trichoderma breve]KAJ4858413.1 alpha/beta-hydrolase lipase region domain-containing protein [Trichoderma breve]